MESLKLNRNIVLVSISSDIGTALAKRYSEKGNNVIGTYRSATNLDELRKLQNCRLFYCDITDERSIDKFADEYKKLGLEWDVFISCLGTQKPIGRFFDCDFEEWSTSVHINAIEQLRFLHEIYPFRNKNKESNAVFFAGGGTNNPFPNYSAYAVSKIMLIKMCELIDSESDCLNMFIVGPGTVKTKMHYETLGEKREKVGKNYDETAEFMEKGIGTSMDDIFNCIEWLCKQGKGIAGGRNFSVVHDNWRGEKKIELVDKLKSDKNMYKLRRSGN